MSLHETRRKEPVRTSAGSLWQDPMALDLGVGGSAKHVVSPRSRTRALSVAYIVNEDASVPQSEENLSLRCLKEACADAHATLKTVSFERISLGSTEILDSFYNAGKFRHAEELRSNRCYPLSCAITHGLYGHLICRKHCNV